jgi:hypothetical protein
MSTINQILQSVSTPILSPTNKSFWLDLEDERKTKFDVDPLACSVSYKRNMGEHGIAHSTHDVTEEDYIQANKIREYYSKKYFWKSLKSNGPQSEYRTNALRLLSINEGWELTDREVGLFVKLPAFYAEDRIYDSFITKLKTDKNTYSGTVHTEKVETLEYIDKTMRWQGKRTVSYWFKNADNKLFGYTTSYNHPFNVLFEEKISTPQKFKFNCGVDNVSDMWYNSIKSFEILKEENA